ncbi:MAG: MFS transporter [Bdellovibrionia bacterium]
MNFTSDRRLLAIFLIVLIDVLGITIILPLLPFYAERFGASPFTVGMLVSSYAICQLISGPILGAWSDRIGRKPVLIVSQIGTFLSFLLLASAPSLFWIFVARVIDGLTAGNLSTAQAYISDIANPKDRAKNFGKISMAFGIGFFVGPALTAFLYQYGHRVPILAAAFLSFSSIMASTFLLPKATKPAHSAAAPAPGAKKESEIKVFFRFFKKPVLSGLLLQILLFYFSFSAYMSGFALFSERRFTFHGLPLNAQQVGYAFTYFGLLQIILQVGLMGKLVERFGERKLARLGFVSSVIGYILLSVVSNPFWIALTGLFTSFGGGVLRPALTSEITGHVQPNERGRIMGVNQTLQSCAQIVAPLVSTTLIEASDLALWALFPALISIFGVMLASRKQRVPV